MITFLTGVPGSGKSYYAVDKIYNNFSTDKDAVKDKKSTYDICYTNINEFNFDKVENCFYLDFDVLKKHLTELHKYYKDKKDDDFLIEKCKEYNILNTLFVIDEAHNYFDTKDTVLIWWLSYHRHLFHEIILITQNLALIESKYKSFSEFFYKAAAQSLTLFRTHFKYTVYCSSRMSMPSKTGTIKVKRNPKVFDLYQSGDSINASNVILKFIFIAAILFVLAAFFIYFYIFSKSSSAETLENNSTQTINQSSNIGNGKKENIVYENSNDGNYINSKFISLSCNISICYNDSISLPVPLITHFIKSKNLNLIHSQTINKNYLKLFLSCSEDFYSFLNSNSIKGSDKNENFNGGYNPPVSPVPTQSR